MNCPALFDEAVKFRKVVVLHALIPLGLLMTFAFVSIFADGGVRFLWSTEDRLGSLMQIFFLIACWFCLALFLLSATAIASYFFHPKSLSVIRQNRAVALSYYSAAPLAYLPLTLAAAIAAIIVVDSIRENSNPLLLLQGTIFLLGFLPLGLQALLMIRVPIVMLAPQRIVPVNGNLHWRFFSKLRGYCSQLFF